MAVTTERSAGATSIWPFTVEFPEGGNFSESGRHALNLVPIRRRPVPDLLNTDKG